MTLHDFTPERGGSVPKLGDADQTTEGTTVQERELQLVPQGNRGDDQTRGRIRAHDAWALELPVLMETMNVRAVEMDLGERGMRAALTVISGKLCLLVRSGLNEQQVAASIRSLLARYIHHPAPLLVLWPDADKQGVVVREPDDVSVGALEDPPDVTADVLHLYGEGHWAPKDGWRSDDDVLQELTEIVAVDLKGVVEDLPEETYPLPEGLGAVVSTGYDSEGLAHPMVFLRGDLPTGLRADLLGFCLALGAGSEYEDRDPDESGLFYVGTDAGPVSGPGAALLGALMVQRLGRRPGDCDFKLLDPPEETAPELESAA